MRITICEFPDEVERKDAAWSGIVSVLEGPGTELVVLPEMPFCAWQMFTTRRIDSEAWRAALAAHDEMIARFRKDGYYTPSAPRVERDVFTLVINIERRAPTQYDVRLPGEKEVPAPPEEKAEKGKTRDKGGKARSKGSTGKRSSE